MKLSEIKRWILVLMVIMVMQAGCKSGNFDKPSESGREPVIEPDYSGVTIPPNIAPLNFLILEKGKNFRITATSQNGTTITLESADGAVLFPVKSWKSLLSGSSGGKIELEIIADEGGKAVQRYNPVHLNVASEPIDPYLCYRLLYPGYRS
jgi:hypothetical protein